VADTFDVLLSKRPYKEILSFSRTYEVIQKEGGVLFDPEAVRLFSSVSEKRWSELREEAERSSFKSFIKQVRERTS